MKCDQMFKEREREREHNNEWRGVKMYFFFFLTDMHSSKVCGFTKWNVVNLLLWHREAKVRQCQHNTFRAKPQVWGGLTVFAKLRCFPDWSSWSLNSTIKMDTILTWRLHKIWSRWTRRDTELNVETAYHVRAAWIVFSIWRQFSWH